MAANSCGPALPHVTDISLNSDRQPERCLNVLIHPPQTQVQVIFRQIPGHDGVHRFSGLVIRAVFPALSCTSFSSAEGLWHRSKCHNHPPPEKAAARHCAKIQRTHKSIFQTNDGFSRSLAMATGFAALGRCPHTAIAQLLAEQGAAEKVSGTVAPEILQMRNTPDTGRENANHAFSAVPVPSGRALFPGMLGCRRPTGCGNLKCADVDPRAHQPQLSSDSACSGMDSGNWL